LLCDHPRSYTLSVKASAEQITPEVLQANAASPIPSPNAIRVAKIATGEIEEDVGGSGKDPAARSLGRKDGAAREAQISE